MQKTVKRFGRFIGNCVSFNYRSQEDKEALFEMIDKGKEITYSTLVKHVPVEKLSQLFDFYSWGPGRKDGLRLKNDWAVGFYRSTFAGEPCYFVRWSAIEYIFMQHQ